MGSTEVHSSALQGLFHIPFEMRTAVSALFLYDDMLLLFCRARVGQCHYLECAETAQLHRCEGVELKHSRPRIITPDIRDRTIPDA